MSYINIDNARLTKDPELRFRNDGEPYTILNIAENSKKKNKTTQEWETTGTMFYTAFVNGYKAEQLAENFQKGNLIQLDGYLSYEEYEGKPQGKINLKNFSKPIQATRKDSKAKENKSTKDPWVDYETKNTPF